MPNIFKAGAQWLHQTLSRSAGESIVYTPVNGAPIDMTATIGETEFPQEIEDNGIVHNWHSRDFIILAEFFVVNGEAFEPCDGDKIEWESGGKVLCFEVRAPDGEQVFRWSDKFHTALRVHTKLAEESAA